MNETSDAVRAAQQTRTRALIVPREHGAWGLLLVPLFTGVVAGVASEYRIWPLLMFTAACAVFILAADTGRKPDWHQFTDGQYRKRTADGACRINSVGGSGDRLFDRADVERTRLTVASSRGGNSVCACSPKRAATAGPESENGGSVGRRNCPNLYCSGCLLHRHWTAKRARLHFVGGQLDLRRQPDSFRSTADPFYPSIHFLSEICSGGAFFDGAAGIFRVLGRGIVLARAPSLGDRCFCSRTCSRNAVVLSKTGIAGRQEPGLVRDERWSGIRSSACGCFHLFLSTLRIPDASSEIGSLLI